MQDLLLALVPMQNDDLDEIMAIETAAYPYPWTRGNFVDALNAGYSGWTHRHNGTLLAYAVTMRVLEEVHLLNLTVTPKLWRQGYGRRMLATLKARARIDRATRMLLEVRATNVPACALYASMGFARIGIRRGYYPAHLGREDAIVMAKDL